MKKILWFCIALGWCGTLYAQDSLKASIGKLTTELNVNPFQGDLSFNNAINQLKFRYFMADHLAMRIGFNADLIDKNNEIQDVYGASPVDTEFRQKSSTFGVNLGLEKHFAGSKRLSPYLGVEFLYVNKSSSQSRSELNSSGEIVETTIEGAWLETTTIRNEFGYWITETEANEVAYSKYGLNLLAGFDFYISKSFFFGYEFNFGFSRLGYKDINITTSEDDPSLETSDMKMTEFAFGANLLNGIRLGFVF